MSDTASAAGTPYPIPYVMEMQYVPDFDDLPHPLIVNKHKRYLEALFKSPGYDIFWHGGIGFTAMHQAVCRRHLGTWISELPIRYIPKLQDLQYLVYDLFRTYPLNSPIITLSYIGREECLAGVVSYQRRKDGERGVFKEWQYNNPIEFDTTEPDYVSRRFERIEECMPNHHGEFTAPQDFHSKIRYDKKEILL